MEFDIVMYILAHNTRMPVSTVTDGMAGEANHAYVIPLGSNLQLARGTLFLSPLAEVHGQHRTVDHFLRRWPRSAERARSASRNTNRMPRPSRHIWR